MWLLIKIIEKKRENYFFNSSLRNAKFAVVETTVVQTVNRNGLALMGYDWKFELVLANLTVDCELSNEMQENKNTLRIISATKFAGE